MLARRFVSGALLYIAFICWFSLRAPQDIAFPCISMITLLHLPHIFAYFLRHSPAFLFSYKYMTFRWYRVSQLFGYYAWQTLHMRWCSDYFHYFHIIFYISHYFASLAISDFYIITFLADDYHRFLAIMTCCLRPKLPSSKMQNIISMTCFSLNAFKSSI